MGKTKENIAKLGRFSEEQVLMHLHEKSLIDEAIRNRFSARAEELVQRIRDDSDPTMMELFLGGIWSFQRGRRLAYVPCRSIAACSRQ